MHDPAVADVHPDVADRRVVEDQVARHQLALADPAALAGLRLRRVRQRDAGLAPGVHHQAGAVERVRAFGAPDVRVTELRHRDLDRSAGAAVGRHRQVVHPVAVAARALVPRLLGFLLVLRLDPGPLGVAELVEHLLGGVQVGLDLLLQRVLLRLHGLQRGQLGLLAGLQVGQLALRPAGSGGAPSSAGRRRPGRWRPG